MKNAGVENICYCSILVGRAGRSKSCRRHYKLIVAEYGTDLLSKNRNKKIARGRSLGHLAARSNKPALHDRETPA